MKKLIKISAVALGVLLATASQANLVHAQDSVNMQNKSMGKVNVQLNVLPSMLGYLSANVNIQIMPSSAIGIYYGMWSWNNDNNFKDNGPGIGYGAGIHQYNIGIQYSYALNGQYMSTGWLVKPFIGYTSTSVGNANAHGPTYGAMIDHQWVFDSGLMIQIGIGPKYFSATNGSDSNSKNIRAYGFAGETNVGYAF